jgi:hypothetical protein
MRYLYWKSLNLAARSSLALCLGFMLLGLGAGGAQAAPVITEFSAGITAGAAPAGITMSTSQF